MARLIELYSRFGLDPAVVQQDLTGDRPIWPFSTYSPARLGPRHLIEGPIMEQSPEEMRLRYYAAMRTGNPQQAVSEMCRSHDASSDNRKCRHKKKPSYSAR